MEEMKKEATAFLLYSYFGSEKIDNDMKMSCAYRAYLDLARTVKYTCATAKKDKDFERKKKDKINEINKYIVDEIEKYSCKNVFNDWHCEQCKKIIDLMKKSQPKIVEDFTYGQAQKWLNMTLKYLWMLKLLSERINEWDLHVPIDSYIIDAITGKGKKNELYLEFDKNKNEYELKTPWSQWTYADKYINLQNEIDKKIKKRGCKSRIEWESKAWIAVSEARKREESKK